MLKFDESQWTVTPSNDGGVPYYTLVGLRSGQRTRLLKSSISWHLLWTGPSRCPRFIRHSSPLSDRRQSC